MKLERSLKRWAGISPEAVVGGSATQCMHCVADAQKDIATISEAAKALARAVNTQFSQPQSVLVRERAKELLELLS